MTLADRDEDFNPEDEDDYESSERESKLLKRRTRSKTEQGSVSDSSSNDAADASSDTESDSASEDDDSGSGSDSDRSGSALSVSSATSSKQPEISEAERVRQEKQLQMEKAEKDLQNIHKKLRKIIEDKLRSKHGHNHRPKNTEKSAKNKSKAADDEYMQEIERDMENGSHDALIDVLQEQPSIINAETGVLRKYQLDGVNWLIRVQETGLNAILSDQMGLGKTLQCIALLAYNLEFKQTRGPTLIVVPKSTLSNWRTEFTRWCSVFRLLVLDGDKVTRKQLLDEYVHGVLHESNLAFDVCITSYEQCTIEARSLTRLHWHYIVVDEAHRMKNEHAKLSQTCRSFRSQHRLLITGTPLQNNLHELWALLNFLIPDAFDNESARSFDILFEAQQSHTTDQQQQQQVQHSANMNMSSSSSSSEVKKTLTSSELQLSEQDKEFREKRVDSINKMLGELHRLLRPLMLRRLKCDVEKSLPPKTEMILYVGMSRVQIALYKALLAKNMGVLKDTIQSKKALLNTAMQLRKVCNHPYLFEGVEDRSLPPHGSHVIENAAKMCMLDKLLPKLQEQDSKCLIFCQMTRMLDILDDYCFIRGYRRCRIDGNTAGIDRETQMDDFNRKGSDIFIFLLSTRAGGLGINLVAADCVIFYDSDWNPQMDLQAQDRAHRIGQTKPVKIFRLVSNNTIEEKILQRAQLKLNLEQMVIQEANSNANAAAARTVSKHEVSSMIKHGVAEIIKLRDDEHTIMHDLSIDEILDRGKEASSKLNQLMAMNARKKFSIQSTDYSLLDDHKLDSDVFRTLAKLKSQNINTSGGGGSGRKRVGGRTTNNSTNGYSQMVDDEPNNDIDMTSASSSSKKLSSSKKIDRNRVNDLDPPDKQPTMQYFQFFEKELLTPLYAQQWTWYNRYKNLEQEAIEQKPNFERYGLSEQEWQLKRRLQLQAFGDWNNKHFWAFVKCCTEHGRENLDKLCEALPMKCRAEIIRYSHAFFGNKYGEPDIKKKIKDVVYGEETIDRYAKYNALLQRKVSMYAHPESEMEFPHAPYDQRAHGWRLEHDRFIVIVAHQMGYGDWNGLRAAFVQSPQFRFDYFIQSRMNNDFNKRMRQLRPGIEKEFGEHIRIFDRCGNDPETIQRRKKRERRTKQHSKFLAKEVKTMDLERIAENKRTQNNRQNLKRNVTQMLMHEVIEEKQEKDEVDEMESPTKKRKFEEENPLPTPPPPTNMNANFLNGLPPQTPALHFHGVHTVTPPSFPDTRRSDINQT